MLPGKAAYGIPADRSSLDKAATVCRHFCQRRNKKCLKRRPQNDPNAGNTYAG